MESLSKLQIQFYAKYYGALHGYNFNQTFVIIEFQIIPDSPVNHVKSHNNVIT